MQTSLTRELQDAKQSSFDLLKQTEKELVDRFTEQYTEIKNFMLENVNMMRDLTEKSSTSLSQSVKSIKSVCSKYFEHYELDLEELRLRTGTLENKYKDWSKVLIEPSTMNEARVFSLEARIEKEEDTRIQEFEFTRDLLRKLVYSLEQLSL